MSAEMDDIRELARTPDGFMALGDNLSMFDGLGWNPRLWISLRVLPYFYLAKIAWIRLFGEKGC